MQQPNIEHTHKQSLVMVKEIEQKMDDGDGPQSKPKGKKPRRRDEQKYGSYIHKIVKKVHPQLSISSKAISMYNELVDNMLGELTNKGTDIALLAKKSTLSSRHVEAAARVALPTVLADHAVSVGSKATAAFSSK